MIVGIDEVGRGCWAGPLVAGAVLLAEPNLIVGLKDSKKLSKKQRERLDAAIRVEAVAYGLGWVTPQEIDDIGLTAAVRLAMERAVACITVPYEQIIIDGDLNFLADNPKTSTLIGGDNLVPSISAASIVAKVARDRFMADIDTTYPGYGFGKHVGYGTAAHSAALQVLGVTDIHRKSFKPVRALLP